MSAQIVARVLHGSHLFGTATEDSDRDYKSVWIPARDDILLGRVNRSECGGTSSGARRNTRFDVDEERHDLLRFVRLLADGQPMAIETLFAPRDFHMQEPHPVWDLLAGNVERLVTRRAAKFIGFCRSQAMAFGLKAERAAAAERAVETLRRVAREYGPKERLGAHIDAVVSASGSEHVGEESRVTPSGRAIRHLRVAGKMAPETATLASAISIAEGVVRSYGRRALRNGEDAAKDWKALSHALRIGYEAVELFDTGRITLPRPEASRLVDVKLGRVDADDAGAEIVALLAEMEKAAERSGLPEAPDTEFLERLVIDAHAEACGLPVFPSMRA